MWRFGFVKMVIDNNYIVQSADKYRSILARYSSNTHQTIFNLKLQHVKRPYMAGMTLEHGLL